MMAWTPVLPLVELQNGGGRRLREGETNLAFKAPAAGANGPRPAKERLRSCRSSRQNWDGIYLAGSRTRGEEQLVAENERRIVENAFQLTSKRCLSTFSG